MHASISDRYSGDDKNRNGNSAGCLFLERK